MDSKETKKQLLSQRVSLSLAEEIRLMSFQINDPQVFVDYLMTITDQYAIEEFFNKCHDENGRFCGGPSEGGRGPGTHKPSPISYIKQQATEKYKTTEQRRKSEAISKVTTSPIRRTVDITSGLGFNPSGFGTVKINRLQKANLSDFGTKDLQILKTRLQASQRQYNLWHSVGIASVPAAVAVAASNPLLGGAMLATVATNIGIARWKTKRIPAQIERIDRTLSKRSKLEADDTITLALDNSNLPTLAEEIAAAKQEIENGTYSKASTISTLDIKEVEKVLSDIDTDEDLTTEQIKAVQEGFKFFKTVK